MFAILVLPEYHKRMEKKKKIPSGNIKTRIYSSFFND